MNWYLKVLKQYADFSGRARRKEFWMFVLFNFIFSIIAMFLDKVLGTTLNIYEQSVDYGWIYLIYGLLVLIPFIAVSVRRLHDIGKSGWAYLIGLIPIVGAIILLVWFCKDSEISENKWGPNPKE